MEFLSVFLQPLFYLAFPNHCTLFTRPGSQLAAYGSRAEIRFALLLVQLLYPSQYADLFVQLLPIKHESGIWVLEQLLRLSARVVCEEDETGGIDLLEEHGASGRDSGGGSSGQGHDLWLGDFSGSLSEPDTELFERIGGDICRRKRAFGVVLGVRKNFEGI